MSNNTKYYCKECDFNTTNKYNYSKHISTEKHKQNVLIAKESVNIIKCQHCEKIYKTPSGLWKHSKNCKKQSNKIGEIEIKEMLLQLMQNQTLLQTSITELQKHIPTEMVTNNTNTNNINIFLNEKCSNAIDIMEFCKAIEVMENHFKTVGEKGYLSGLSEILSHNLSKYSIFQRPIHCIKDKEDDDNDQIHIRYNQTWTPETRQSNVILKTAVDEIDGEVYRKFEIHSEENGKMNNHNVIENRLLSSWDLKPDTADKLLEIVVLDIHNVASNSSQPPSENKS
jgi:hypothetical protein